MEKITYGFYQSPFGEMVLAESAKGLCWLGFMTSRAEGAYKGDGLERMKSYFKKAEFTQNDEAIRALGDQVMEAWQKDDLRSLKLDLRGTDFQLSVWQALLDIPKGHKVSYKDIANDINNPDAARPVGSAVGENPVSLVVPCHRVVQKSGKLGNYGWGLPLKKKLLEIEGAA